MEIYAKNTGGIIDDGPGADKIYGHNGDDIFNMTRDAKTDQIARFDPNADLIDLSEYNVTWHEVEIEHEGGRNFRFTIRGETTKLWLLPSDGEDYAYDSLTEDMFVFAVGAADPIANILLDANGKTTLTGTDQPDDFIMVPDGTNDVIKRFDPLRDQIDLAGFGTDFDALEFTTKKPGSILIELDGERITLRDLSNALTAEDLTEDMFIFI